MELTEVNMPVKMELAKITAYASLKYLTEEGVTGDGWAFTYYADDWEESEIDKPLGEKLDEIINEGLWFASANIIQDFNGLEPVKASVEITVSPIFDVVVDELIQRSTCRYHGEYKFTADKEAITKSIDKGVIEDFEWSYCEDGL